MTTTSAGSTATPYCVAVMPAIACAQRRDAECVGVADALVAERLAAPRRAPPPAPACRAGRLRDGSHRAPAASRAFAARSTSIAIKGGTSPRREDAWQRHT